MKLAEEEALAIALGRKPPSRDEEGEGSGANAIAVKKDPEEEKEEKMREKAFVLSTRSMLSRLTLERGKLNVPRLELNERPEESRSIEVKTRDGPTGGMTMMRTERIGEVIDTRGKIEGRGTEVGMGDVMKMNIGVIGIGGGVESTKRIGNHRGMIEIGMFEGRGTRITIGIRNEDQGREVGHPSRGRGHHEHLRLDNIDGQEGNLKVDRCSPVLHIDTSRTDRC